MDFLTSPLGASIAPLPSPVHITENLEVRVSDLGGNMKSVIKDSRQN